MAYAPTTLIYAMRYDSLGCTWLQNKTGNVPKFVITKTCANNHNLSTFVRDIEMEL